MTSHGELIGRVELLSSELSFFWGRGNFKSKPYKEAVGMHNRTQNVLLGDRARGTFVISMSSFEPHLRAGSESELSSGHWTRSCELEAFHFFGTELDSGSPVA